MAISFEKLKVKDVIRRTKDAVSVHFELPSEKTNWNYTPGQYITLRFHINGSDERRAYSLSTSPDTDSDFGVTVKEVDGGKVSTHVNRNLKAGDTVDVMPPLGNFTVEVDESKQVNYILWAGGSGITPIISIIKSVLKVETKSRITLFYANREKDSIIFLNELSELAGKNSDRLKIIHILDSGEEFANESGILDSAKCSALYTKYSVEPKISQIYMCGPSGLMDQIESSLSSLNVEKSRIHKELFTASENQSQRFESERTIESSGLKKVTVMIYGEEHEIEVKEDETILQAGIRQHLDPPFSCQIAACATCQAKVLSGKVEMEADDALTEDEIEDGYVLTCVAHPVTDSKIDFDY